MLKATLDRIAIERLRVLIEDAKVRREREAVERRLTERLVALRAIANQNTTEGVMAA